MWWGLIQSPPHPRGESVDEGAVSDSAGTNRPWNHVIIAAHCQNLGTNYYKVNNYYNRCVNASNWRLRLNLKISNETFYLSLLKTLLMRKSGIHMMKIRKVSSYFYIKKHSIFDLFDISLEKYPRGNHNSNIYVKTWIKFKIKFTRLPNSITWLCLNCVNVI